MGDLRILGEVQHTIDTNVTLTERFAISNDGIGPALEVIQYGTADVATFIDDDKVSMIIKDGGNIGINTTSPGEKLHVEGNALISSNMTVKDTIYASNIESADNTVSIIGSNVLIKDILNVTNDVTYISNDVSLVSNLYAADGLIMKIPVESTTTDRIFKTPPQGQCFTIQTPCDLRDYYSNGVKEWLPFGGVVDIDGDTYISAEKTLNNNTLSFFTGDKDVPVAILKADILSVSTDVYMDKKNLTVKDTIYASNIESSTNTVSIIGSNVSIKDILNVTDNVTYIQMMSLASNLYVDGLIMKIPVGTNNNRPNIQNAPTGSVFYNSNTMRFEGLHDLNGVKEWLPFGGVVDIDGDTYISAEKTPNNNTLSFFTGDKDVPVAILKADILSAFRCVYG